MGQGRVKKQNFTAIAGKEQIPEEYLYIGMIFLEIGVWNYGIDLLFLTRTSSRGIILFYMGVVCKMH